jgi:predicted enzyme related to lactoylglutathione lyase
MSDLPENLVCWTEIPVTDLDAARAFYAHVLKVDLKITDGGPNPIVDLPAGPSGKGVAGHLYPGTPSRNGPTIHFIAPDSLDATRARITAAGGAAVSPDITIPPGTFFYARDLDGNSIGFFNYNS